ncbi:MAG: Yip1 family protein [Bacteroidota bacterium]|nr:Yip1 family protein [Bacteroidota bacterium]MDP4236500.1 Yip1 family protein [Bacteroidota bacterium]
MSLVDRAKNIIITPKTEWAVIAGEEANASAIYTGYVLPFLIVDAVFAFIGHAFIWGFGHYGDFAMRWGIYNAVLIVVGGTLGVWLTAMVVNALAPSFGSEKNMGRAMQLVAYSYTPAWVGGLLMILPMIGWIGSLFGLYGIYLIYLGLPHIMKTPADKVITYMVIAILVLIGIYIVVGLLFAAIFLGMFGLGVASSMNWRMNM